MYMTSGVVERKSEARQWMTSALYGLLVLAAAYLILNTINPDLVNLNFQAPGSAAAPSSISNSSTPVSYIAGSQTTGQTSQNGKSQNSSQGTSPQNSTSPAGSASYSTSPTGDISSCDSLLALNEGGVYILTSSGASGLASVSRCEPVCKNQGGAGIKAVGAQTNNGNAYTLYQCVR